MFTKVKTNSTRRMEGAYWRLKCALLYLMKRFYQKRTNRRNIKKRWDVQWTLFINNSTEINYYLSIIIIETLSKSKSNQEKHIGVNVKTTSNNRDTQTESISRYKVDFKEERRSNHDAKNWWIKDLGTMRLEPTKKKTEVNRTFIWIHTVPRWSTNFQSFQECQLENPFDYSIQRPVGH